MCGTTFGSRVTIPSPFRCQRCRHKKRPTDGTGRWRSCGGHVLHHSALATQSEGKAWFAIMPPHSAADVVGLPRVTET